VEQDENRESKSEMGTRMRGVGYRMLRVRCGSRAGQEQRAERDDQ